MKAIKIFTLLMACTYMVGISQPVSIDFELVESTIPSSCGDVSDCDNNVICFDILAKADLDGVSIAAYDIVVEYPMDTMNYLNDASCIITDGGDFPADALGFYRVAGNNGDMADTLSNTVFQKIHNICFTYTNILDLKDGIMNVGGTSDIGIVSDMAGDLVGFGNISVLAGTMILLEDQLVLNDTTVTCIFLPVDMANFDATKTEKETVMIDWTTLTEQDNKGFYVERSANGRKFIELGFVAGANYSQESIKYAFEDKNPLANNYYRLRQENIDGSKSYTDIKYVEFEQFSYLEKFDVSPNPFVGEFNVAITNPKGIYDLYVYNLIGEQVTVVHDVDSKTVQTANYPTGTYFVKFINSITGQEVYSDKIIRVGKK